MTYSTNSAIRNVLQLLMEEYILLKFYVNFLLKLNLRLYIRTFNFLAIGIS